MRTILILVVCLVCHPLQSQRIARIAFPAGYGFQSTPGVGSIQFINENQLTGYMVKPDVGSIFLGFLIPVFSTVSTAAPDHPSRQIKVFPNPFEQTIKIESNGFGSYTYHVMDVQGHLLIYGKTSDALHRIHTQFLPPGMYVLRITGQDGHFELHKITKM